ncbi:MAG: hypothetical protein KJ893_01675 [Candidatus Omnitrophica bacterium]|nr:hypothetical protein [Candidatus Omnitrophota bacterium]MBU4479048.1 hypothetical protein [Candidatus Omnitrophota bacterium]MCG2702755.1 hypothetical protein [Candidatus Omnitrophota bacterium]
MLDPKVAERITRALNFQETDCVPICDFIDNSRLFEYFSHKENHSLEEKVKAYHGLGVDVCWRFNQRLSHRENGIWANLRRFAMRAPRFRVITRDELFAEFDDFAQQQELFQPYTYLAMSTEGCLSVLYRGIGFEEFTRRMYEYPIETERLIDIFAENLYQKADEFARRDLGGIFFIKDDIAYDKGLIFSLDFLQKQWLPRIKQAIRPLKDKNVKVILHSEGDIGPLIDGLISIGIDGIHPVDSTAGMDASIIKKKYGRSLILFGSIELNVLPDEEVIAHTNRYIRNAACGAGCFLGTRFGITNDLDLKRVFSFFNAIKEH